MKSDLIVPLVIWKTRPSHIPRVLHIIPVESNGLELTSAFFLATGAQDGSICLYKPHPTSAYTPQDLLLAHTSSIVGLDHGSNEWADQVLLGASQDGTISSWRISDAQCLLHSRQFAQSVAPVRHFAVFSNGRYAVAAGEYSDQILVFDTWSMVFLHSLSAPETRIPSLSLSSLLFVEKRNNMSKFWLLMAQGRFAQFQWQSSTFFDATTSSPGTSSRKTLANTPPRSPELKAKKAPASVDLRDREFGDLINSLAFSIPNEFQWDHQFSRQIYYDEEAIPPTIQILSIDDENLVQPLAQHIHFPRVARVSVDSRYVLFLWENIWCVCSLNCLVNDGALDGDKESWWGKSSGDTQYVDGKFILEDELLLWTTVSGPICIKLTHQMHEDLDASGQGLQIQVHITGAKDSTLRPGFRNKGSHQLSKRNGCNCSNKTLPISSMSIGDAVVHEHGDVLYAQVCKHRRGIETYSMEPGTIEIPPDETRGYKAPSCSVFVTARALHTSLMVYMSEEIAKYHESLAEMAVKSPECTSTFGGLIYGHSDGSIEFKNIPQATPTAGTMTATPALQFSAKETKHKGEVTALAYVLTRDRQREAYERRKRSGGVFFGRPSFSENSISSTNTMSLFLSKVQQGVRQAIFSENGSSTPKSEEDQTAELHCDADGTSPLEFLLLSGCAGGKLGLWYIHAQPKTQLYEQTKWGVEMNQFECIASHHHIKIMDVGFVPTLSIRANTEQQDEDINGRLVYAVGADHSIALYHIFKHFGVREKKYELVQLWKFQGHTEPIRKVDWKNFYGMGTLLVHCEDEEFVYVWNTTTGVLERCIPSAMLDHSPFHVTPHVEETRPTHYTQTRRANPCLLNGRSLCISSLELQDLQSFPVARRRFSLLPETENRYVSNVAHLLLYNVHNSGRTVKATWTKPHSTPIESRDGAAALTPSMEIQLLVSLHSWGLDTDLDRMFISCLGLNQESEVDDGNLPSYSTYSFALKGPEGALSVALPYGSSPVNAQSCRYGYWTHSPTMTAMLQLAVVSLCMNLMDDDDEMTTAVEAQRNEDAANNSPKLEHTLWETTAASEQLDERQKQMQILWSRMISLYSIQLPEKPQLKQVFETPQLMYVFASYVLNSSQYTQMAARLLLQGVIDRMPSGARSAACAEWAAKLYCGVRECENSISQASDNRVQYATVIGETVGPMLMVLSLIAISFPGDISPAAARQVCDLLLLLLNGEPPHICFAAELLSKGIVLWRPHLVKLPALVQKLIHLTVIFDKGYQDQKLASAKSKEWAAQVYSMALRLLIEIGACEPELFLQISRSEITRSDLKFNQAHRTGTISCLIHFFQIHGLTVYRYLPAVIETLMASLDPAKPECRKYCLQISTKALHEIVLKFPMVCFHKETQRLAVGTSEAVIIIYDVRTATKWRVLDGHTAPISALIFSPSGDTLISYSARELSVRWWPAGSVGLFGGLLALQARSSKQQHLHPIQLKTFDLNEVLRVCKLRLVSDKAVRLIREDGSIVMLDL